MVIFTVISLPITGVGPEESAEHHVTVLDKAWFYFTRMLDAGTMGDDAGELNRVVSTGATLSGNGLVETDVLMPVSARLIVNRAALKTDARVAALVERFRALAEAA